MFKIGQAVMRLSMWTIDGRKDVGATYWGEWPANSSRYGQARIKVAGTVISAPFNKIMDAQEYFDRTKEGKLPSEASGRLWLLEGDYKSGN